MTGVFDGFRRRRLEFGDALRELVDCCRCLGYRNTEVNLAVVGVLMQPAETVKLHYFAEMSDVYMYMSKSRGPNTEPRGTPHAWPLHQLGQCTTYRTQLVGSDR